MAKSADRKANDALEEGWRRDQAKMIEAMKKPPVLDTERPFQNAVWPNPRTAQEILDSEELRVMYDLGKILEKIASQKFLEEDAANLSRIMTDPEFFASEMKDSVMARHDAFDIILTNAKSIAILMDTIRKLVSDLDDADRHELRKRILIMPEESSVLGGLLE
jgi:hypothetical protein